MRFKSWYFFFQKIGLTKKKSLQITKKKKNLIFLNISGIQMEFLPEVMDAEHKAHFYN